MPSPRKPFCPNGHDIALVGRYTSGGCKRCAQKRAAVQNDERRLRRLMSKTMEEMRPQDYLGFFR